MIAEPPTRSSTRYKANLIAGGLRLRESRIIAGILLEAPSKAAWRTIIGEGNALQARSCGAGLRLAGQIRTRLSTLGPPIWRLVHDGTYEVATQALMACAVKQSALLADFLKLVVHEHRRRFQPSLSRQDWTNFLGACRERDFSMPEWSEGTKKHLGSAVFQMLGEAGYIERTPQHRLLSVLLVPPVIDCLEKLRETDVLACLRGSR